MSSSPMEAEDLYRRVVEPVRSRRMEALEVHGFLDRTAVPVVLLWEHQRPVLLSGAEGDSVQGGGGYI